jgi:nucleoside-diphosphate-sugar epimerase
VFIPRISWTIGVEMNRNNGMRSDFLYDIIDRKDIIIKSDGKRILPFCYISDICAALFYIYFFGKVAEPYNIVASDGNLSVEQFANLHTKILNVSSKVIIKNDFNDGKPNIIINSDKLSSIGWQSRTTIENGIQKIYNYMVSQNKQCI